MQQKIFALFMVLFSAFSLEGAFQEMLPSQQTNGEGYQNDRYMPNGEFQMGPMQRNRYEDEEFYDNPYVNEEFESRGTRRNKTVTEPYRYNFDNQEITNERDEININTYKPGASATGGGSTSTSRPFVK